jgi:4a-hydroxytetrahydrobiopterin dehydratase
MAILSEHELREALAARRHWRRVGDTLVRERSLRDFGEALAFVERVGRAAEDWGRHPDVAIMGGNRARVTVTNTHGAGFTDAELRMVAKVDEVADAPPRGPLAAVAASGSQPAETAGNAPEAAPDRARGGRGAVLAAGACGLAVGAATVLAARRL